MNNNNFWSQRVKNFGHTGWADIVIYAFDQPNRIEIVHELIEKYTPEGEYEKTLLDFGCGTGEFTKNELPGFGCCVAYDTCAEVLRKINFKSTKVCGISEFDKLKRKDCKYNVVISITVMQHILEDDELHAVLEMMHEKLDDNGIIILLESLYDKENSYIRTWNYGEFNDYFLAHGFHMKKGYDFYPETIYKNKDFLAYSNHIDVRIIRKVYKYLPGFCKSMARAYLDRKARHYKKGKNGMQYLSEFTMNNGYKFMVYQKD